MALYINIYRTKGSWAHMKAGDLFVHEENLPTSLELARLRVTDNPDEYEYTIIEHGDGMFSKLNLLTEVEI